MIFEYNRKNNTLFDFKLNLKPENNINNNNYEKKN